MGGRHTVVRLLLDTHAFVWAVAEPERLSSAAVDAIRSSANQVFVSSATAWELATKYRIGKLPEAKPILDEFEALAQDLTAKHLPMNHAHATLAGLLPGEHRDPFDRMIAAQAKLEGLNVLTRDPAFKAFDVPVVW